MFLSIDNRCPIRANKTPLLFLLFRVTFLWDKVSKIFQKKYHCNQKNRLQKIGGGILLIINHIYQREKLLKKPESFA